MCAVKIPQQSGRTTSKRISGLEKNTRISGFDKVASITAQPHRPNNRIIAPPPRRPCDHAVTAKRGQAPSAVSPETQDPQGTPTGKGFPRLWAICGICSTPFPSHRMVFSPQSARPLFFISLHHHRCHQNPPHHSPPTPTPTSPSSGGSWAPGQVVHPAP